MKNLKLLSIYILVVCFVQLNILGGENIKQDSKKFFQKELAMLDCNEFKPGLLTHFKLSVIEPTFIALSVEEINIREILAHIKFMHFFYDYCNAQNEEERDALKKEKLTEMIQLRDQLIAEREK
ncbi:MAG: hypothetical protein ACXWL5_04545 [Candidatus Chromulinivorax sp.]